MKIDITTSVLMRKAIMECETFVNETMAKYEMPEDMKEFILELLLSRERERKLTLYSSAIAKGNDNKNDYAKVGKEDEQGI